MKYEISDIVTLSDDNDYVISSIANYQNQQYALLININNKKHIMYTKIVNDNFITLEKNDTELINKLNKLFFNNFNDFIKTNQL